MPFGSLATLRVVRVRAHGFVPPPFGGFTFVDGLPAAAALLNGKLRGGRTSPCGGSFGRGRVSLAQRPWSKVHRPRSARARHWIFNSGRGTLDVEPGTLKRGPAC